MAIQLAGVRILLFANLILVLGSACACRQKMATQPSYGPLQVSAADDVDSSARPPVVGTIPRGHLQTDRHRFTGTVQGSAGEGDLPERRQYVETFPMAVTRPMLEHGYQRFTIYCVPCHDPLGSGRGRVVERGYSKPPSYHTPRLRETPVGRLFAVISEGYGSMPSHAEQISVDDRWAIVAYIRALQLSQHWPESRVTPEMRARVINSDPS